MKKTFLLLTFLYLFNPINSLYAQENSINQNKSYLLIGILAFENSWLFKNSNEEKKISIKIKINDKIIGKAKIISIVGNEIKWNLRILRENLIKITNSKTEMTEIISAIKDKKITYVISDGVFDYKYKHSKGGKE